MGVKRIKFLSKGFQGILTGREVGSLVASEARKQASRLEASTGEEYEIVKYSKATSRTVFLVRPKGGKVPDLDHETWMSKLWPKVGGPPWRPHR